MHGFFTGNRRRSWRFWIMAAFIGIAFLLGGGSRPDVQSAIFLRPIAIIMCCFAAWSLNAEHISRYKFIFILAGLLFSVIFAQLVILPTAIWTLLPGRELIAHIDSASNIGQIWRPIAMIPAMAWNAFFSLFTPLAILLFGAQLSREERTDLVPVIIAIGMLSGLLGLLQIVSDPNGPLYFYRITNNGAAVGLFANRNHQAVFLGCLFPMMAFYVTHNIKSIEQYRLRMSVMIGCGIVLIPLLLVTGSRMGLMAGIIGLLSIASVYKQPNLTSPVKRKVRKINPAYIIGAFAVIFMSLLSVMFARAQAFERFFATDEQLDLRFKIWGPIAQLGWKYFPIGSGAGSFSQVYQIDEELSLIYPNYINHAHNDFLEVFLNFGLIGILLILVVLIAWLHSIWKIWRHLPNDKRGIRIGKLGIIILGILAFGSSADYPLRNPSLMALWTLSCIWIVDALTGDAEHRKVV